MSQPRAASCSRRYKLDCNRIDSTKNSSSPFPFPVRWLDCEQVSFAVRARHQFAERTSVQRSMDNGSSIWTALTQSSYGASWRAVAVDSARRPRPRACDSQGDGQKIVSSVESPRKFLDTNELRVFVPRSRRKSSVGPTRARALL